MQLYDRKIVGESFATNRNPLLMLGVAAPLPAGVSTNVLKHFLLLELQLRSECSKIMEREVDNIGALDETLQACRLELIKSRKQVQANRRSVLRLKRNWENFQGDGIVLARRRLRINRLTISCIKEELTDLDESTGDRSVVDITNPSPQHKENNRRRLYEATCPDFTRKQSVMKFKEEVITACDDGKTVEPEGYHTDEHGQVA